MSQDYANDRHQAWHDKCLERLLDEKCCYRPHGSFCRLSELADQLLAGC